MSNSPAILPILPIEPIPVPILGVFSSADALAADLAFGGTTTQVGPVAPVSGHAPPAYDDTSHINHLHTTVELKPGSLLHPTLRFDENGIDTDAYSSGIGVDSVSSHAQANIGSDMFLLTDNPSPLAIAAVLGLSLSATGIHASADFSRVFGPGRNFVAGDASFGSLTIGGSLLGRTLSFSGNAAPNTVLFSSPTITVTLDRQIVTDLLSIGPTLRVTPMGITTEAIDISLHNASFLGTHISGDIVIGEASAGTAPVLVPLQPSPLA